MPTTVSKNELDELVELMREYRERTGDSVTAIANKAGLKREMVSRILSGNYASSPSFEVVAKICRVAGVQIRFDRAH